MLPQSIKIAGVTYWVTLVKEISDDPHNMGEILYHKSIIKIKEDMSSDKQFQTLIHEIIHACLFEIGYQDQEEEMVERLGMILHQVLIDNKHLNLQVESGEL